MIRVSLPLAIIALVFSAYTHAEIVFLKQNSEPKYFAKERNTKGLCDLIYAEMSKRLEGQGASVTVNPKLYPIKRILAMLSIGHGHVYCGAGRNKKREELYHYSQYPVYQPSNVLLMHQDDQNVLKELNDLENTELIVGAFFGASSTTYLRAFEGIRVVDHFRELNDGLKAVADKNIHYFFYHNLGLVYLLEQSDLPIKLMPTKFRTYDHWLIYSKLLSSAEVKLLDKVLKSMMDDGTLDSYRRLYLN